jgi:hypothetical protein
MIIWSGFGFLVLPIVIAGIYLSGLLTGQLASDPDYYDLHGWPMGVGIALSGVACWFIGRRMHASGSQTLIDPKTGGTVVLHRRHSLFFIPVQWWVVILVPIGAVMLTIHKTPEELTQSRAEQAIKKEERAAARSMRRAMKEAKAAEARP